MQFNTSPVSFRYKGQVHGAPLRSERWWVAETASLKVNFLATYLKITMESKKLGSSGILAMGKLSDPSRGSFEVSRLDAFELLEYFQITV